MTHIAVLSSTTFPSALPDDLKAMQGYGSESQAAATAKGFIDRGHNIDFYAALGSSKIGNFHPLWNTKGLIPGMHTAEPKSELLDDISIERPPASHTDLLRYDFVIDYTKVKNNIEELKIYSQFNRYAVWASGFNDYVYPFRLEPNDRHLVTHCKYFADFYNEHGILADVVYPVIDTNFWRPQKWNNGDKYIQFMVKNGLQEQGYFLFPHRINQQKGIEHVLRLAKDFPNDTFVVSTSTPLQDHKTNMAAFKVEAAKYPNIKVVECPENHDYQFYRRQLYRDAKCILSPFSNKFTLSGEGGVYMDTSGITSLESIACGTPVICSRSPGSEEFLSELEHNGVIFIDGYDSLHCAVKHESFSFDDNNQIKLPDKFNMETHIKSWEQIMSKYR